MCALAIPTGATAQEGRDAKSRLSTTMAGAARPQDGRAMRSAREDLGPLLRCDFGLYFCCASFNLASAPASVTEFFGNQPRGSVSQSRKRRDGVPQRVGRGFCPTRTTVFSV